MKSIAIFFMSILMVVACKPHKKDLNNNSVSKNLLADFEHIRLESRIKGLKLGLLHLSPTSKSLRKAVLFIHGASFPSELAAGFRMSENSWMDDLAEAGYDVYALDFLGYGKSDRYGFMLDNPKSNETRGLGIEVTNDIDIAVNYILKKTRSPKIDLIGHSWGGTVAGHYSTIFPQKVNKLVLFAPFVQRTERVDWDKPRDLFKDLTPDRRVQQFLNSLPKGQKNTLEKEVMIKWKDEWLASDSSSQNRTPSSVRFPSAWQVDLFDCWSGNCFFTPSKVVVPTLVIRGEWDTVLSFDDADWLFKELANAASKKYVVIDKSTHVTHLEKNRFALYDEVKLFLK